jgi:hypothetical protein
MPLCGKSLRRTAEDLQDPDRGAPAARRDRARPADRLTWTALLRHSSLAAMDPITLTVLVVVVLVLIPLVYVWRKGRRFAEGDVFRASRLSAGNRLFPTQVLITPQSVVRYTPQWIGRLEHSIHMAHVASVSIDTNLLFSDVYIETTGGTTPIHCKGHSKGDALEIKRLIEQYQTSYYQQRAKGPEAPTP